MLFMWYKAVAIYNLFLGWPTDNKKFYTTDRGMHVFTLYLFKNRPNFNDTIKLMIIDKDEKVPVRIFRQKTKKNLDTKVRTFVGSQCSKNFPDSWPTSPFLGQMRRSRNCLTIFKSFRRKGSRLKFSARRYTYDRLIMFMYLCLDTLPQFTFSIFIRTSSP